MQEELDNIKEVYSNRNKNESLIRKDQGIYNLYISAEREAIYGSIIRRCFSNIQELKFLEVGAGAGGNLSFFHQLGIPYSNIVANELLDDRIKLLKNNFTEITIIEGNAAEIQSSQKFDIVFQSTVFTSILSDTLRRTLSEKMWKLLNDKGIILWYDFVYDNPNNKNVKKVTEKEIRVLFSDAKKIEFYKVTLAPPIGRRVGKLYAFFNTFKFLRTHVIALIHK